MSMNQEEDPMLLVEDDVMVIVIKIRRKCVYPILVYGGAICESSPSRAQSRKVIHLEKIKIFIIDLKWIMSKAKV